MIKIIAAIGKNGELGKNNSLIWHIPADMKFFKEQTIGKKIVMGSNTFNSLPKLLPARKHIVLSKKCRFNKDTTDVLIFNEKEKLIDYCINSKDDIYIIGGASIYSMFINIADQIILTEIQEDKEADVYFPKFDKSKYVKKIIDSNIQNGINFKHVIYTKNR